MIDTHCHLEMLQFKDDLQEVLNRAKEAGIEALVTIGSDFKGCKGAVDLSKKYDFVYAAVGIHPHDAKDLSEEIFGQIRSWISESRAYRTTCEGGDIPRIVALGEIGLDYYYDHSPREIQRTVFAKQLAYAKECDLPVVIHSRDAREDTFRILEESGVNKGVMHCFSVDADM